MTLVAIDTVSEVSAEEWRDFVGEPCADFASEKEYTQWLLDNVDVLRRVIGIDQSIEPICNAAITSAYPMRPDMIFKAADRWGVVEVKLSRNSNYGRTQQLYSIGQTLLYREVSPKPVESFIIDVSISAELIAIVNRYRLPITLIEANTRHFAILRANGQ